MYTAQGGFSSPVCGANTFRSVALRALCIQVTLLIPWLNQDDQAIVFHGKFSFHAPEQQTECIKDWLRQRTGFEPKCQVQYYPGRYDTRLLGIFPVGDLTVYVPPDKVTSLPQIMLAASVCCTDTAHVAFNSILSHVMLAYISTVTSDSMHTIWYAYSRTCCLMQASVNAGATALPNTASQKQFCIHQKHHNQNTYCYI